MFVFLFTAEESLNKLREQPGFVFQLLQLVSTSTVPLTIRQAGAIFFKNFIIQHWVTPEGEKELIRTEERAQVKEGLVALMLRSPLLLQKQLGAALTHIAKNDFPTQWPTLLPSLLECLKSNDLNIIISVLRTLNALFKGYRDKFNEEVVLRDLKYILDMFAPPFLAFSKYVNEQIDAHAQKERELVTLFTILKLLVNIYYSLTVVDLPEHFEDNFNFWMPLWHKYLSYRSTLPTLIEGNVRISYLALNNITDSLLSLSHGVCHSSHYIIVTKFFYFVVREKMHPDCYIKYRPVYFAFVRCIRHDLTKNLAPI